MKELMIRKLRSDAGETITEVLVSLLISAIALAMLASMIQASANMITTSKDKLGLYYDANNNLGTQTTSSTDTHPTLELKYTNSSFATKKYTLTLYENKEIGNTTVISYTGVPTS